MALALFSDGVQDMGETLDMQLRRYLMIPATVS
jgi:hypothetical protein